MGAEDAHREPLQREAVDGQRQQLARGPARAQGRARVPEGEEDRGRSDEELVDGDGHARGHAGAGPVTDAP